MPDTTDPLRDFFRSLTGKGALPLESTDPYYEPILEAEPTKDPILQLAERLLWEESESVSLLTGFRGNGKSTQLRRLRRDLEAAGCRVLLVNMADYLLMSKPLELSDFLLSLTSAVAKAVEQETGLEALSRSYGERLHRFLSAEVRIEGLQLDASEAATKLGPRLQIDPDFKKQVQEHLRGHLTTLVHDAHDFLGGLVDALRAQAGDPDLKVVLLVDSVEQLRGSGEDAGRVQQSVVDLFSGQASSLALPRLHVVYTVPPFLPALAKNLGRLLGGHRVVSWPNIHVRRRDGEPDPAGLRVMQNIIARRYPLWEAIIPEAMLQRLATTAGGDLRDYFRLVRECIIPLSIARRQDPDARLTDAIAARAIEALRNDFLPIAEADARWLARIHATKEPALPDTADLPTLARFFDTNLILNYVNGQPWYDIHPVLLDEIRRPPANDPDAGNA